MAELKAKYSPSGWYVETPINEQTLRMEFQVDWQKHQEIWYNVYLVINTKRKHRDHDENNCLTTGKYPFASMKFAIQAFKVLEETVLAHNPDKKVVIYCRWVDNRRRDVYYKVLRRWGYDWGRDLEGHKCILKRFTPDNS